jgi:DNA-binding MarR family transcriptional regulator
MTIAREFDKVARDDDFSIAQYRFLLYLKDGPRRAGEVAATSLVTKATISGHIAALREKGWITVEAEAFDRRAVRLVLSHNGREAMENYESKLLECLAGLVDHKDLDRFLRNSSELYWALSATRETRYRDLESPDYKFLPPSGVK